MDIFLHEIKEERKSFLIWTVSISAFIIICILLYPEMRGSLDVMTDVFSSMGSFSAAFGMDRLAFGTFLGFYGVECGTILGLGGALYASLTGIGTVAKEEKGRSAEFLFTHPVSRKRVLLEKYGAMLILLLALHAVSFLLVIITVPLIGETLPLKELSLIHLSYCFLSIEIGSLSFGLSTFLPGSGMGVGIGMTLILYFMNLMVNISEKAKPLSWLTPFSYANGTDIVLNEALDWPKIITGLAFSLAVVALGSWHYSRRDLKC